MLKEKSKKIKYKLEEIEDTEYQLEDIEKHSFGYGTSFSDIDNFLKPIVKVFLEAKLRKLETELEELYNQPKQ